MGDTKAEKYIRPLIVILLIHGAALVSLRVGVFMEYLQLLFPYSLILVALILLYYQKRWNFRIIGFLAAIYIVIFALEAYGVATGNIFGSFRFGKTLGVRVLNTPILIGIHWLILIYSVALIVKNLKYGILGNTLIGTIMLIAMDILIEPIAMRTGMWTWNDGKVPLTNYITWSVLFFIFTLALLRSKSKLRNEFAPYLFIIQLAFYLIANVL